MSLLIALPGPPPRHDTTVEHDALPQLPALTGLLMRARRLPAAAGWRSGVLDALCGAGAGAATADVTLAALDAPGMPRGAALCFASPLHVVAGISRVHLPPGGWLRVDAQEAGDWAEAFNHQFAGPDVRLHCVTGGWLLAAPFAQGAREAAPEMLLGEPLARAPARDADERALRRLGAEAEMWLQDHPLNAARQARGQLPINSLWFWGGAGSAAQPPAPGHALRGVWVAGEPDAWLAGLAGHCAAPLSPAHAWPLPEPAADTLLVLLPPCGVASTGYWQELEAHWFAPLATALRRGELGALRLQIGASAWRLPAAAPLRWLRRRRPWHLLVRS